MLWVVVQPKSWKTTAMIHPCRWLCAHAWRPELYSYITAWRNHLLYEKESKGCAKPMIAISTQPFFYTAFLSFSTTVQYLKKQPHLSVLKSFYGWLQELPPTWLYANEYALYKCPCMQHYPPHSPTAFHNLPMHTINKHMACIVGKVAQDVGIEWKCCGVLPI